jgi:hypothetical protein
VEDRLLSWGQPWSVALKRAVHLINSGSGAGRLRWHVLIAVRINCTVAGHALERTMGQR